MNYIQSPIGLVPKSGGQTRLIFHLSYNFSDNLALDGSVNHHTPEQKCTVKYKDLDYAVRACLRLLQNSRVDILRNSGQNSLTLFFSKSDLASTFRNLPIKNLNRNLLLMKTQNPITGETLFFIEKCLPFGASILCSHFQRFSNCLYHILEWVTRNKWQTVNYLDDYLFIERSSSACNAMVRAFLDVCNDINFPVFTGEDRMGN